MQIVHAHSVRMPGNLFLDLASQVLGEFFGHVSPVIGAQCQNMRHLNGAQF
jgi:hypothetical protein